MRVFVDTGVYLDYLKGKGVRLKVLETFRELLEQKKFKLIFPDITKEEIYRGIPMDRGRYSVNKFLSFSLPDVPAGVEEDEKYKEAKKLFDQYGKAIEEVRKKSLGAVDDILKNYIEKLMSLAEDIRETERTISLATTRKLKGNPPGKNTDPLGDEIAWELLLEQCIDDDLVVIAHDGDWKYAEDGNKSLHPFLQKEWEAVAQSKKISLFPSLAPFIESIAPKKVTKAEVESEKKEGPASPSSQGLNIPAGVFAMPMENENGGLIVGGIPSVGTWSPVVVTGSGIVGNFESCDKCHRMFATNESRLTYPIGFFLCPACRASSQGF